ncbi:phosphopantothenoylcysteine synthetase/decarboxylase [Nocardioides luteus]|uniref:Flavoprotein n=1 Tax=Nocardioides luteus TaxID=1844 RepID=A0ABQ5SZJ8_9ACTN|nr:flavoprotein [Nocardioides luteus]MDR7310610.1 phosphopantothenoylcysteine synthetase/decarboxylase [Nocardioides luteus]GGR41784.1 flavoprotein [Nocardioides luteus]GLJ69610.1 flavoprotein [Nocardioides luteus]
MATIGVIASAAGGVDQLCDELVMPLVDAGHQVPVTLTPTAFTWLSENGEAARIEAATGFEVRGTSRLPWEPRTHPAHLDVIVVAPATFSTTAKIALGLADNQALTVVTENLATTPVVLFPLINAAHAQHSAWPSHMAALRSAGVHLIEGPDLWPLHPPRQTPPDQALPWQAILDSALRAAG